MCEELFFFFFIASPQYPLHEWDQNRIIYFCWQVNICAGEDFYWLYFSAISQLQIPAFFFFFLFFFMSFPAFLPALVEKGICCQSCQTGLHKLSAAALQMLSGCACARVCVFAHASVAHPLAATTTTAILCAPASRMACEQTAPACLSPRRLPSKDALA